MTNKEQCASVSKCFPYDEGTECRCEPWIVTSFENLVITGECTSGKDEESGVVRNKERAKRSWSICDKTRRLKIRNKRVNVDGI